MAHVIEITIDNGEIILEGPLRKGVVLIINDRSKTMADGTSQGVAEIMDDETAMGMPFRRFVYRG